MLRVATLALVILSLTLACGGHVDQSDSRRPNDEFVASQLHSLLTHRSANGSNLLDDAIREMVIYLCDAQDQMATNIREATLDELLSTAHVPETLVIGCGYQRLRTGEVVHGTLLVGRLWVGPAFRAGRRPPPFREFDAPLQLNYPDAPPPGNWQ